jgi:uncharacterized protein (TIGR03790 family)
MDVPLGTGSVLDRPPLSRVAIISLLILAATLAADRRRESGASDPADPMRSGPLDHRHLALVINQDDPLSEATGRLYQRQRRIPDAQVIRVRLPVGESDLPAAQFVHLQRQLSRRTPAHVQAYALAWTTPWRVGCQSITAAISLGRDNSGCRNSCRPTRLSPYHARGDVTRPWDSLRLRPSMMLASSDIRQAQRLIARGIAADGTAPPGTAYLLSTSDVSRNGRANGFAAVQAAVGPGFRVRVLQGESLRGAPDVMAYFTGLAQVPDIDANHYRPGAVADHLTSFGGQLTDSPQMSAMRWLEAGATGSYGTVVEPCSLIGKFPDPGLFLAYYRRGDTLIEAYWRSVAMPDQGVFIGEPLARPWPARAGVTPYADGGARPRRVR